MIKKRWKSVVSTALFGVFLGCFIYGVVPQEYNGKNVILSYGIGQSNVLYVEDNQVTMIGSQVDSYILSKQLKELNI